jgi:hypothetical protein
MHGPFKDKNLEFSRSTCGKKGSYFTWHKKICVLLKGILTPSFIEIELAVTKRALLTDDDARSLPQLTRGELKTKTFDWSNCYHMTTSCSL